MKERVLFSWSGGKDSALALYEVSCSGRYEVVALLTTLTEDYDRISMHGVRRALVQEQADSLGFPLEKVFISRNGSQQEYDARMRETLMRYLTAGASSVVIGDIFLEDVRKYREDNLSQIGMRGIFPLWKKDTTELAREFIRLGFKAIVTCVDSRILDRDFVGRFFDETFLSELPSNVDPCGENGEYHTFVFDGPSSERRYCFQWEILFCETTASTTVT